MTNALFEKSSQSFFSTLVDCVPNSVNISLKLHPLTQHQYNDAADLIPLITGSFAEFYIEPILAIPSGHPPPTQLPNEFNNSVDVHEITEKVCHSHFPGYVYLKLAYIIKPPLATARAALCDGRVHLFVCSSVCLSPNCKNAIFSKTKQTLWCLLTTNSKSYTGFSRNPLFDT